MSNFTDMHLRLVKVINDQQSDGTDITLATQDGKVLSSAQRSKALMAARYWVWSVFRVANKQAFNASSALAFVGSGVALADITALNITSPEEMALIDTSTLYGKPIPIVKGSALPLFIHAMRTSHSREMVAGIENDLSGTTQKVQLKLIIGSTLNQVSTAYNFVLSYLANPKLDELVASSAEDVVEPRSWWDAMEKYAEAIAWQLSANIQRATASRKDAYDSITFEVETQFGKEASQRVSEFLRRRS